MVFFFFKQKTAYEMRISDWSSDVCSSDLASVPGRLGRLPAAARDRGRDGDRLMARAIMGGDFRAIRRAPASAPVAEQPDPRLALVGQFAAAQGEIGRASCRERVCQYV